MLITPQEFLTRSQRYGLANGFFKNVMIDITNKIPVDLLYQGDEVLYFIAEPNFQTMYHRTMDPTELDSDDDELYVEAFKLLKVISD